MFEFLIEIQRIIRSDVGDLINRYADSGDLWLLMTILPFGVFFGAVHALTPGHSKTLLATYIVGSETSFARSVGTSLTLSLVHITSGVLLATVANGLLTRTLVGAGQAPLLQHVSQFAVVLVGLWMVFRPLFHAPHFSVESQSFAFVAGLVPCPLTLMTVMLALSRGVPAVGYVFAISMFIGVSIVLSAVAGTAFFARTAALGFLQKNETILTRVTRWIEVTCGLLLVAFAVFIRT